MNETERKVAENVDINEIKEKLIIKFYNDVSNTDIIMYTIGNDENGDISGIFIDRYGELVGSITRDLTESLKKYTDMPKVYNKYILHKPSTIVKIHDRMSKAAHNASDRISNVWNKKWFNKTGGKTKSKRSPNANKTLKNRK